MANANIVIIGVYSRIRGEEVFISHAGMLYLPQMICLKPNSSDILIRGTYEIYCAQRFDDIGQMNPASGYISMSAVFQFLFTSGQVFF